MRHSIAIAFTVVAGIGFAQCGVDQGQPEIRSPHVTQETINQSLCVLVRHIPGFEGSGHTVVFPAPKSGTRLSLIRSPVQIHDAIEFYRVTSGFFTRDGQLGITNAGMNEVVLIDPRDGTLASRIGSAGPGPSEFAALYFAHFRAGSNTIAAFDFGAQAAKEFTASGSLVRFVRLGGPASLRIYDAFPIPGDRFMARTVGRANIRATREAGRVRTSDVLLVLLDSAGAVRDAVADIRGPESVRVTRPEGGFAVYDRPFANQPWVVVDREGCVARSVAGEPAFIVRDPDGALLARVELPFVDVRIGEREWAARIERMSEHGTPDIRKPDRRPAWSHAAYNGGGQLWLEVYHHFDEPTTGWWVVDFVHGTTNLISAPNRSQQLLAVDGDKAVIKMLGDNDIERVVFFSILQPGAP